MELIFLSEDGTEEITRCEISDELAQRLIDGAKKRGLTLEEYILTCLERALDEDEAAQ